ncbi:MAG: 30S ribosome-binding factor RbfA [Alphaproteobacteria bacterium]|nr:30S ribosome-binding factor RbfA [Alphaproteobacteria bacterium]
MPRWRPARVAEMVHREVASRLRTDLEDPDLGDVSITRVEVPRDLGSAVVFWLPLGGGTPSDTQLAALERAARQLRGPVGRALRLRTAPELRFEFDQRHEEAIRVTSILHDLERGRPTAGEEE